MDAQWKAPKFEDLEFRLLFAWSSYAQLVNQDTASADYAGLTGAGVAVAVIDTGIDYNLDILGGGFGAGHKVVAGYDFADNDADPMDESGHGTQVASVIAANPYTESGITYQGVAPDANLIALRAGTADSIPNANIEKALQWVIANHQTYHIAVVNLSLGSGNYPDGHTDTTMSDEFAQLHNLGIFVTAASGNSNDQNSGPISEDGIAFPAADPNVFAVGAVNSTDVITTWTQRGDELDLLAPGVGIVLPKMGGGYEAVNGTSFSSPCVAGTAALIKQADNTAKAGDIGSILMSSGAGNRDGDTETGNTTGLLFSRLDIGAALAMASQRVGKYASLASGKLFNTALDSQGVLHASFFDAADGDLMYATRATSGLWSDAIAIDTAGVVGSQSSIAVDPTGKIGIGYFDNTNTDIKYAWFDGSNWHTAVIDSKNHVGNCPSLAFDTDGNAYLGYHRRSSGDLKLATLDRDTGTWSRFTVDGNDGTVTGASLSVDVGEAALRSGSFTVYDTTVAVAYSDSTNGNLKYARIDVDDPNAAWFYAVVEDANGVGSIDLDLHAGPTVAGLQAQIAYQDRRNADVKYAYRNTDWFVETVAQSGHVGASVQMSFDSNDIPSVSYFWNEKHAIYTSTRESSASWPRIRTVLSAAPMVISTNERSGEAVLSYVNRARTDVFSNELL